jgi:hypothetical protein
LRNVGSNQKLRAMTSGSAPPARPNFFRSIVAGIVSAGFLWMVALSVSPQLHASVHSDASDIAHHCGATLLASGNCQDAPSTPPVASPVLLPVPTPVRVKTPTVQSPFLIVRVLEHAPPVAA